MASRLLGGATAMSEALVTLDNLTVKRGGRAVLSGIHGSFERGSMTAIMGANGAGKSTLLKSMMGLLPSAQGSIVRIPHDLDIAYLPQQAAIDHSFPVSVGEVVAMGAWQRVGGFGALKQREWRRQVADALYRVGFDDISKRSIGALSTGQFQRVLFARLLLQDADMVLLDEPFAGVDAATTRDLLALVCEWHQQGRTIVAVLHDINQVMRHFPSTLLLAGRQIAWGSSERVLSTEHLQQALGMSGGIGQSEGNRL